MKKRRYGNENDNRLISIPFQSKKEKSKKSEKEKKKDEKVDRR